MSERDNLEAHDVARAVEAILGQPVLALPDEATINLDKREYLFILQQLVYVGGNRREQARGLFAVILGQISPHRPNPNPRT